MSETKKPIILYDGACNLCNSTVDFVLREDSEGIFKFAPLQSQAASNMLTEAGHAGSDLSSVILIDGDRVYFESTAILKIIKKFGGYWKAFYYFAALVPRTFRDNIYRFVKKKRYNWFGKSDKLFEPPEEYADRFIGDEL